MKTHRPATTPAWHSAGFTHVGHRRPDNEDHLLEQTSHNLWVVADGMGGHSHGEYASQYVTDQLAQVGELPSLGGALEQLSACLQRANGHLCEQATAMNSNPSQESIIGTTVVLAKALEDHLLCLWVGDSRLYRLRQNRLTQITQDHTLASLYETHGDDSLLNTSMGETLSRAVGGDLLLTPDYRVLNSEVDDRYLLCSDGIDKELDTQQLQGILSTDAPLETLANRLKKACLASGAKDNITAIILHRWR